MICKGRSRRDAGQLIKYLLSFEKNDSVEVLDERGLGGRDLRSGFRLAEVEAEQTNAKKTLYHAQIAPAKGEVLTTEQKREAVAILERRLGYEGLPRVVVVHRQKGHEHIHVAWSRFDRETGKLRRDSFTKRKNVAAASEISERFGFELVRNPFGKLVDGLTRLARREQTKAAQTQAEYQQDERAAAPRDQRQAEITALWESTDSGKAFRAALEAAGYTLATGRRGFVVLDASGEIHSLARQIHGAKAADVRARLSDLDHAQLPEAEALKSRFDQAQADRAREAQQTQPELSSAPAKIVADAADIAIPETIDVVQPSPEATHQPSQGPGFSAEAKKAHTPPLQAAGEPRPAQDAPEPLQDASAVLDALTKHHSTFGRADLARIIDRATGGGGRESWMMQTAGFESLGDEHKASAERSYAAWSDSNPDAARRHGISEYVSYVQAMQAGRNAEAPEARQTRIDSKAAFDKLMAEVEASPDLIRLGPDRHGRERFTSRAMIEIELTMQNAGDALAGKDRHGVDVLRRDAALAAAEAKNSHKLGAEQRAAFEAITAPGDLSLVVGFAGSGKSTMLDAARMAWEAGGYRVRGAALSGIAAEGLQKEAGIQSRTLHSLLHQIDGIEGREAGLAAMSAKIAAVEGRTRKAMRYRADLMAQRAALKADIEAARLSDRDVLVIDEAAMVGSRQMERLLTAASKAGVKVVLVGDAEQLQAIDAGATFRALRDRHGAAEITEVRRQREQWQRVATREFATGGTQEALERYRAHGLAHQAETRDQAKTDLIDGWTKSREEDPDKTRIILAYTRTDVAELNQQARARYRAEGRLGEDHSVKTASGTDAFAPGDRMYFTKNDTRLGVRNGTLGTVEAIDDTRLTVRTDGGRTVTFDTRDYGNIVHGYAATVHKSQGVTVDRAHVLASRYMDRHAAYVGMTRHRDRVDLHYGADEFKDFDRLARRLSRDGGKDTTLDYVARAERGEQVTPSLIQAVAAFWARIKDVLKRPAWLDEAEAVAARASEAKRARETDRHGDDRAATSRRSPPNAEKSEAAKDKDRSGTNRPSDILMSMLSRMTPQQRAAYEKAEAAREAAERLRRELEHKHGRSGPYRGL